MLTSRKTKASLVLFGVGVRTKVYSVSLNVLKLYSESLILLKLDVAFPKFEICPPLIEVVCGKTGDRF